MLKDSFQIGFISKAEWKNLKPNQTIEIKVHPLVHIEDMDRKQLKKAAIEIEKPIRDGLV